MDFTEKTLSKETIFKGKVINVEKHHVQLPDGKESIREVVLHPGAVAVLAVRDHKILLVEQYRKAMDHLLIEVPAGKVEPGEDRKLTAERELEEETGYKAQSMELISEFYVSPGFCNEWISLYIAHDLYESSELTPDDDEFVNKYWVDITTAQQWLKEGKICDAKTIIALQYYVMNYLIENEK